MAQHAAVVATFDMTAKHWRATGDNGVPRLLLDGGQGVGFEIGLTVVAQNLGQAQAAGHAELAGWRVEQIQW